MKKHMALFFVFFSFIAALITTTPAGAEPREGSGTISGTNGYGVDGQGKANPSGHHKGTSDAELKNTHKQKAPERTQYEKQKEMNQPTDQDSEKN